MSTGRKEATPVELAALLMDVACTSSPQEQEATRQLAAAAGADAGRIQSELMFLRAFAVDLATGLALGESQERQQLLQHFYDHWERIDRQVDGVAADLQQRQQLYADAVGDAGTAASLQEQVGAAFVRCCGGVGAEPEAAADLDAAAGLAALGGALFGTLCAEVVDLLQEIDITLGADHRESNR